MAFFRNNIVNLLNLHYGIFAIVMNGAGPFICVFLLRNGVSLPGVLVTMAAIQMTRFLIRPAIVPLAVRFGMRPLVIAGAVLMALQFPIIAQVHGVGTTLYALILVSAIADTMYWPNYHAYFASLGDDEHRGHQISVREAIAAIVGIFSPLLTGWLLVTFGPMVAFGFAAAVSVLGAIPLFWTPNVAVVRSAEGAWRAAIPGVKLFAADGWIASGFVFTWQLALFLSLRGSYLDFGGALAIAALVGAVAGMFLGRHIDAGHGGRAVFLAFAPFALLVLFRSAAAGHSALAVAAATFTFLGNCLYTPTLMTAVYNTAKGSPCALRFHIATEGGWDAGCVAGCLTTAAFLYFGVPMSIALLLPLIGATASFILLRRYYATHAVAIDRPVDDIVP